MAPKRPVSAKTKCVRPVGEGHSASCTTWSGSVSKRPGNSSSEGSSGPPSLCPPIVIDDPSTWSRRPRSTRSFTSSEFDSGEDRGARDSKYFGNSADAEGHAKWDDWPPLYAFFVPPENKTEPSEHQKAILRALYNDAEFLR
ncbi:unnamed protein product, partial [Polarella glacialis]